MPKKRSGPKRRSTPKPKPSARTRAMERLIRRVNESDDFQPGNVLRRLRAKRDH
ncbi:MAG: hypothetical protein KGL39_44145 [Patescibacteria group bacterium]|nr:hypothetical protein [Patescibacteria group bacterium]